MVIWAVCAVLDAVYTPRDPTFKVSQVWHKACCMGTCCDVDALHACMHQAGEQHVVLWQVQTMSIYVWLQLQVHLCTQHVISHAVQTIHVSYQWCMVGYASNLILTLLK